ncbi:hypothetical protein GCM10010182_44270 [Actinomadura cremea]|nr:hypothetical protein GCM10010182_44270 [Actinomadura cremea]
MRSSELAALAGVTVRTLRHYHQIGILDEPERSVNGYRDYDVRHLSRLVRITRLAELGLPLAALPDVLDDPEAAETLLDELDRQAAAEIERLTSRRADIARVRRHGAMPDLPPEMAAYGPTLSAVAVTAPDMVTCYRPLLENWPDIEFGPDVSSMLAAYGEHNLNDEQRRANQLFAERVINT